MKGMDIVSYLFCFLESDIQGNQKFLILFFKKVKV